jgi:hypothetical protein
MPIPASIGSFAKTGCHVDAIDMSAKRKMKDLVIDERWISLIISGEKTWEMRSRNPLVRGRIALIRKGSKTVIGTADPVLTLPKLSPSELIANVGNHRVPESEIGKDSKHSTAVGVAACSAAARIGPLPPPCRRGNLGKPRSRGGGNGRQAIGCRLMRQPVRIAQPAEFP